MKPVTSREKEMYNLTPHAARTGTRHSTTHNTRKRREVEASGHGGVDRSVVARVPDTRALCGGLALWGRARTWSAGVRGPAAAGPACGAARPLPSLRPVVGTARAARAPLRKHRLGGGRTAAASGGTEGSARQPHGLAYTASPSLPRLPPPSSPGLPHLAVRSP